MNQWFVILSMFLIKDPSIISCLKKELRIIQSINTVTVLSIWYIFSIEKAINLKIDMKKIQKNKQSRSPDIFVTSSLTRETYFVWKLRTHRTSFFFYIWTNDQNGEDHQNILRALKKVDEIMQFLWSDLGVWSCWSVSPLDSERFSLLHDYSKFLELRSDLLRTSLVQYYLQESMAHLL